MSLVNKLTEIRPESVPNQSELEELSKKLRQIGNLNVYEKSIAPAEKAIFFMATRGGAKTLGILSAEATPPGFGGSVHRVLAEGVMTNLATCSLTRSNAAALRNTFGHLRPTSLGLAKSFGCGDRLGLATPGHIRAFRKTCGSENPTQIRAILAQQSMRENARTGRDPQSVQDDATWGVFQEGWRAGFAADADHLKTIEDIDLCVEAGYTFFTIDPGAHVDESADELDPETLKSKAEGLPWTELEITLPNLLKRLVARPFDLGESATELNEEQVLRAVVKYGRVIAHTTRLYRHLSARQGDQPFDLEMSVDETNSVTSVAEHLYIASELKRLGVQWVSLAPRYVGRFEKGVDYMGADGSRSETSLAAFEASFAAHAAVARSLGPYKLSLHSGSDKFSIYPICARLGGDLIHVKTAGTSYLEALRALATLDESLFREILCFALERYATDRVTYHVSAEPSQVPDIGRLSNEQIPALLDDFHARQALHVTFGSVLGDARLRSGLFSALESDEELHYQILETHFEKHLKPFCGGEEEPSTETPRAQSKS
jgi:tagaturonate epimerase